MFEISNITITLVVAAIILLLCVIFTRFDFWRGVMDDNEERIPSTITNEEDSIQRQERGEFLEKNLPVLKWGIEDKRSVLFSSSGKTKIVGDQQCNICMEPFREGADISYCRSNDINTTTSSNKRNHVFHLECIKSWLLDHSDCPTCRSTFFGGKDDDEELNEAAINLFTICPPEEEERSIKNTSGERRQQLENSSITHENQSRKRYHRGLIIEKYCSDDNGDDDEETEFYVDNFILSSSSDDDDESVYDV
mmetsp:Transcript_22310/g.32935  ORF Transcript_22310/g.32935 Transcript_22310/m.32935 type:complete len:251 (-) Transcript_22310:92-844(-)